MNIKLVGLPLTCLASVGLLKVTVNAWVSALGPEAFCTLPEASDVFSSSDPPDDPGPRDFLERLISLKPPFCLCFLFTRLAYFVIDLKPMISSSSVFSP